ncbi:MAG TPA: Ppx/GppA phosphatase family protein [Myxococcaceae bacterium]|nr:Ppx/GppA phosphatase family protein [Myxococcaceae bacterium]
MARYASIDIGTNSVLLLVAEKQPDGTFTPVVERAEITRLGRGVDKTRTLSAEGMEDTLRAVTAFAEEARAAGAQEIAVSATSAARDASNGREFLDGARTRAGVTVEIISGELEAQLSSASAYQDFARKAPERPLVVLDIGGGSTEFIYGQRDGQVAFRHSFDVGSVRLTERFVTGHPLPSADRERIRQHLRETFAALPPPPERSQLVGVAGTVTTLYSVLHRIDPYDSARVHGAVLPRSELSALVSRLCDLPLEERRQLPGLQPKRADVICAGGLILEASMERLGARECVVSDRGLRWGLLAHRFGGR